MNYQTACGHITKDEPIRPKRLLGEQICFDCAEGVLEAHSVTSHDGHTEIYMKPMLPTRLREQDEILWHNFKFVRATEEMPMAAGGVNGVHVVVL